MLWLVEWDFGTFECMTLFSLKSVLINAPTNLRVFYGKHCDAGGCGVSDDALTLTSGSCSS